jgi:hypothetical protein
MMIALLIHIFSSCFLLLFLSSTRSLSIASAHAPSLDGDAEECPLHSLQHFESSTFSQNGEDGITTFLLNTIGIKYGTYAEFGVQDGTECNTRVLREHHNFTGLGMDGGNSYPHTGVFREYITVDNIVELFEKYNVQRDLDVLSVDLGRLELQSFT